MNFRMYFPVFFVYIYMYICIYTAVCKKFEPLIYISIYTYMECIVGRF